MIVRVTTAAQAAAIDARAIEAGTASYALMEAAGRAAAAVIAARLGDALARGAIVFAGPGNNGGDGYIVATALRAAGARVSVFEVAAPKTDDAKRARAALPDDVPVVAIGAASAAGADAPATRGDEGIVIDALLGTGASGAPRGEMADAIVRINERAGSGATVVSLDVPSGLDASTGAAPGPWVRADLTVTFGTVKRGLLRNRDVAGAIVCVDIGLGDAVGDAVGAPGASGAPELLGPRRALVAVPSIPSSANKGSRRRLLVVGGSAGMAGAAVLAARGALRSGIGMVRLCVEQASVAPVQSAEPAALTAAWPADDAVLAEYLAWAHCVLLGPGLGLAPASRELALRVLRAWRGPVVVDADALTAFEDNAEGLGELLGGRPAIITPHPVEAQRLAGVKAADIDAGRFEAAPRIASRVKGTVLLKGVPTVVSDGAHTVVVAAGTPVLATGGSGDVLGGIAATLLAQTGGAMSSAATAAWVHGRAAELAGAGRIRGVTLDDVVAALRTAWVPEPAAPAPVIAELPRAGDVP